MTVVGGTTTPNRRHGADPRRTPAAFFAARCRLDRMREITGLDLDAAAVRLRLQLALHVHLALFSGAE